MLNQINLNPKFLSVLFTLELLGGTNKAKSLEKICKKYYENISFKGYPGISSNRELLIGMLL